LSNDILEQQLLDAGPVDLGQVGISQTAQLLVQNAQIMRRLFTRLGSPFVDDPAGIDLEQSIDDEGNAFRVDDGNLVRRAGKGARGESRRPARCFGSYISIVYTDSPFCPATKTNT
jgi:hypothetical protein